MTQSAKKYRLPFDLPPSADHEILIDPGEFAAMMSGEDIEIEAAELLAISWTERADGVDPLTSRVPDFGIVIPRRFGLTARESKEIADDSARVRKVTLALYEMIDRISSEVLDRSIETVHTDVMAFGETKYLVPYLRPYLDDLMRIDDYSPHIYSEKLSTIHMQRVIPEWTIEHTATLRSGMVASLLEFAMIEEGAAEPKKISPEAE